MAHETMRVMDVGRVVEIDHSLELSRLAFYVLKLTGELPTQVVDTVVVRTSKLQAAKGDDLVGEGDCFRAEINWWARTADEVQPKHFAWLPPQA